jgi:hypothetical protein
MTKLSVKLQSAWQFSYTIEEDHYVRHGTAIISKNYEQSVEGKMYNYVRSDVEIP